LGNRVGSKPEGYMSLHLVNQYLNDLDRYKKIGGTDTEGVISEAFKDLLKAWARQANLHFINQYEFQTAKGNRIRPDGTILHELRVPLGYWEAKDSNDDLDEEIAKKQAKGYPQDNIIYEDSNTAVLIQNRNEMMRCSMLDTAALHKLVTQFFRYEREEIAEFRKAVEQFKTDMPAVLEALREKINDAYEKNKPFKKAADLFLKHAKNTINPNVSEADIREMLIQHILTEEIFARVFDQGDFHRENNIAKELYNLEAKFFFGDSKRNTLKALEPYYAAIRHNAAIITSHSEKQTFLKVIYENFYKVYNPKAADRLGVVYTPNEIVKFMIEGADWLCHKHFGKNLIDRDVEILDPAAGTGTFICELLEHFRGQPQKLAHKYKNELHANEVAILPYYVANLNIEATYAAISGQFAEYPNLCFVDTLDNVAGLGIRLGQHVGDLFGAMSEENVERVKRQNKRKISVIIGNPPYNANQANENDNNKNRTYDHIDKVIKATYIKQSTAQKTKLYDMYARFFRWASDRMNDDGVLAFITNRSFIESRTFDGFRKVVAEEFNEIYVMDLGGDVRANPKLSGTKHNVFGIQTGVAISFFVKRHKQKGCKILYARRPEMETAEDKLGFVAGNKVSSILFEKVVPDKNSSWLNLSDNDWENLLPLSSKASKAARKMSQQKTVFQLFSLGVVTARDDWVYDFSPDQLRVKVKSLISRYNTEVEKSTSDLKSLAVDDSIKWSRAVKRDLEQKRRYKEDDGVYLTSDYRPFVRQDFYYSPRLNEMIYQTSRLFGRRRSTKYISYVAGSRLDFCVFAGQNIPNYAMFSLDPAQNLPSHRYSEDGERIDNITDWGLKQFQAHFERGEKKPKRRITKDDIFNYVYAVLHDPLYREKYAINLKREFPRVPFYPDFFQWAEWGKHLMELHIGYETVKPWALKRQDAGAGDADPKPMLKADKINGIIQLDSRTSLSGIPAAAWDYRLGNRSGLEWILDQYKEKKPKDPTIREKFNSYRFKDYKEKVIDLLARVTRVSVETMVIVDAMKKAER
jgi:predicted helicase